MDIAGGEAGPNPIGDRVTRGQHQRIGAQGLAVASHCCFGEADIDHAQSHRAGVADQAVGVEEAAQQWLLDVSLQGDVVTQLVARFDVLTGDFRGREGVVDAGRERDRAFGGTRCAAPDPSTLENAVVAD